MGQSDTQPELVSFSSSFLVSGQSVLTRNPVATSVYTTVFNNELSSATVKKVSAAVLNAGLPQSELPQLLSQVSSTTLATSYSPSIVAAASAALNSAYCRAIFVVAMVSMAFGIVGLIACACCKDVDHRMNNQIEVYLENDRLADRNKNH